MHTDFKFLKKKQYVEEVHYGGDVYVSETHKVRLIFWWSRRLQMRVAVLQKNNIATRICERLLRETAFSGL